MTLNSQGVLYAADGNEQEIIQILYDSWYLHFLDFHYL
jgi:hypothetical protein